MSPQGPAMVTAVPAKGGTFDSLPFTNTKVRAMNAQSRFSSQQPGRDAAYAVDNSSGTWWEPSPADAQPTLTVELSPATRFDVVQLFTIDSVRLLFTGGGRLGRAGATPAADTNTASATTNAPSLPPTNAHQYKIDVSTDRKTFTTVLDQSPNTVVRNTIFEEISPTTCSFVRLTMINWPRATPLGIIEFTIFGKAAEWLPAAQPIPGVR